ncbi:MAG: hypothetical protein K2X69_14880 [Silvanigrellaceae bacterium]|nr:hypothetical protein [Silvanigrellaceae bacterium]
MTDYQVVSESNFLDDNEYSFEVDSIDMTPQIGNDYHSFDPDISDLWEK